MKQTIKVGLVEDQLLFRTGIKAILQSWEELEVVFESGDGYSVIERLQDLKIIPDVMLVDLSLPPKGLQEYSGEHLTMDICRHFPEMRVIILSVHRDESYIARLIETGAHGYLVKDSDPQEVFEAIEAVYKKGSYINQLTLKAIQQNMGMKSRPIQQFAAITKREVEILQLTCRQYTAEEIAAKLFISVKTVNGHRNNLLQKTGSRNVTGLVIYAIKNNLVELV